MWVPSQRLKRLIAVLSGACLLTAFTPPSAQSEGYASAVRSWIEGWVDAAIASLDAERPTRERDLNRAVVSLYGGADVVSELNALQGREPRWAPAQRWLTRARESLAHPADLRAEPAPTASAVRVAAVAGSDPTPPGLHPGELLRYRVKYLLFNLATITLATGGPVEYRGHLAHQLVFSARSNDGIPFFHIDSHFESMVAEDGAVLGHRHVASDSDTGRDEAAYDMDRKAGRCTVRTVRDGLFGYEVLPLPENAQDGVSVLRVARALARVRGSAVVPTAVDAQWWPTELRTLGVERLRWQGREVSAVHMQSVGAYKGPGGLSGTIDFWMSDDERSVPYKARMKVAVGSVSLELLPDDGTVPRIAATAGAPR
jgi:hypothetical protein